MDSEKQSLLGRPGVLAAMGLVALVVVCATIVAVVGLTRGSPGEAPAAENSAPDTSASSTPDGSSDAPVQSDASASSEPAASGDESVCGLAGVELEGTVSEGPLAEWKSEGMVKYPTSPTYGPGKTDGSGFRYCFQRTPTGALFAAANAAAPPTDPAVNKAWGEYVLAPGKYRDAVLAQAEAAGESDTSYITQFSISAFSIPYYDGEAARVQIAVYVTSNGQFTSVSYVYELKWVDGDWKISTDTAEPMTYQGETSLDGLTPWGPWAAE